MDLITIQQSLNIYSEGRSRWDWPAASWRIAARSFRLLSPLRTRLPNKDSGASS